MTPTPQQLAKAREVIGPCGWLKLTGNDCAGGEDDGKLCFKCSLVPRVAALLAEVEAPLTDELDDLKRGLAEQGFTFDGNIVDAALHFVDSLKAETQRLAGELARSLREWSDIETEVEQRVSTRRIQAEFELNEMRAQCNSLRARLNLKHSASHTDATQALCGAPPPYVWDNDSGVFCPACKKVETLTSELARARADETANAAALRVAGQRLRTLTHPPDEGESK